MYEYTITINVNKIKQICPLCLWRFRIVMHFCVEYIFFFAAVFNKSFQKKIKLRITPYKTFSIKLLNFRCVQQCNNPFMLVNTLWIILLTYSLLYFISYFGKHISTFINAMLPTYANSIVLWTYIICYTRYKGCFYKYVNMKIIDINVTIFWILLRI